MDVDFVFGINHVQNLFMEMFVQYRQTCSYHPLINLMFKD